MSYKSCLRNFVFAFAFLSGCTSQGPNWEKLHFRSAQVAKSDKDIVIPKPLVEIIKNQFEKEASAPMSEAGAELSAAVIPRKYLGLKIMMTPKTAGVLAEPIRFDLPRGGAIIDFSEWISATSSGSFFLKVQVEAEGDPAAAEKVKVYFFSRSRKRTVDEEEMGAGCNKYMDLTQFYQKTLSRDGVRANTTDQRHLSLLAGTFYFIYSAPDALHLASLTFEDPRYPSIQCAY